MSPWIPSGGLGPFLDPKSLVLASLRSIVGGTSTVCVTVICFREDEKMFQSGIT